ncbi:MAG: WYL domain-containing protein [Oscillospiraceae bacterium]|nr:WYL domain-containing protein [Oscillospiraceae bacterium]
MPYNELIKDFRRIRTYLKDFYVYGFKVRSDFSEKSTRSYDNERRRIESWMGDYVSFSQDSRGKRVYLSVDSRQIPHNPLYRAFKAKSFTDKDILLHFCLMDLFQDQGPLGLKDITSQLEELYPDSVGIFALDEKTVRLKVQELADMGILEKEKLGRKTTYRLVKNHVSLNGLENAIDFYSEALPLGVVGSYLLDKLDQQESSFRFKHHYPMQAIDSEVMADLLEAIHRRCFVEITVLNPVNGEVKRRNTPIRIYVSAETGREYVASWSHTENRFFLTRIDRIMEVKLLEEDPQWEQLSKEFTEQQAPYIWGMSSRTAGGIQEMQWLEMEIIFAPNEQYILQRLKREKRRATLTRLEEGRYLVRADVFDAYEMMPWILTFTGRITRLQSSNLRVMEDYRAHLQSWEELYGKE